MSDNKSNVTETGLPKPWTVRYSRSHKREYFFDPETKQSVWEAPENTDQAKLGAYLNNHPLRVRCLHLLIKHSGSRRPASHRSENITLSKEDAIEELQKLRDEIVNEGASFKQLAEERSDCSSYKRGGDLGFFGRKEMQPAFEDVSFKLKVGEISEIVETDSGVHIIKRVA